MERRKTYLVSRIKRPDMVRFGVVRKKRFRYLNSLLGEKYSATEKRTNLI